MQHVHVVTHGDFDWSDPVAIATSREQAEALAHEYMRLDDEQEALDFPGRHAHCLQTRQEYLSKGVPQESIDKIFPNRGPLRWHRVRDPKSPHLFARQLYDGEAYDQYENAAITIHELTVDVLVRTP